MNIFKMKAEDALKLIDEILDDITKEDLVKELQNSGFNVVDTVNNLHKADEMFEKLGYTRTMEPNEPCNIYYYADIVCKDEFICFDLTRKNFRKVIAYHDSDDITIDELQAINQKCKELGWV